MASIGKCAYRCSTNEEFRKMLWEGGPLIPLCVYTFSNVEIKRKPSPINGVLFSMYKYNNSATYYISEIRDPFTVSLPLKKAEKSDRKSKQKRKSGKVKKCGDKRI